MIDNILNFLSDAKDHFWDEICCAVPDFAKLDPIKRLKILAFLNDYGFIESDNGRMAVGLTEPMLKFWKKIEKIENRLLRV